MDASRDSGADSPDDASGDRCRSSADCDDGDPRTMEQCYTVGAPDGLGWCHRRACGLDSDCDDANPTTYDTCELDASGTTTVCRNVRYPNRCVHAEDCLTADALRAAPLPCVTATCDERGLCAYSWPEGCGVSREGHEPPRSCALDGAVEGARCCESPCTSPCLVGAVDRCETILVCEGVPSVWSRVVPAGPECPSTSCPTVAPSPGTSCETRVRCDYGRRDRVLDELAPSVHLGEGPRCRCTDGRWACHGDPCPARPPEDGSLVELADWATGGAASCDYLGRRCLGAYGGRWRCITPLVCPQPAPRDGDACLTGADESCSYERRTATDPPTAYTGTCRCGASSTWSCSASLSSACPESAPEDHGSCTSEVGNERCTYFSAGTARTCRCTVPAPGLRSQWSCT